MMLRKFSFSWKSNVVHLQFTFCVLSPKPYIVVIGINNLRVVTRRLDEEIANAGVPPRVNQDLLLEEVDNDDQAPANPPSLSNRQHKGTLSPNVPSHYYSSTSRHYSSSIHDSPR